MKTPTIQSLAQIISDTRRRLSSVESRLNLQGVSAKPAPLFAAQQTATQAVAGLVWVSIALDTVIVDNAGGQDPTATSRYLAQRAGWYSVIGVVGFAKGGTSFRAARLAVNGVAVPGSAQNVAASGDYPVVATPETLVYLAVGDYLELQGFAGGATSTATDVPAYRSRLNTRWLQYS